MKRFLLVGLLTLLPTLASAQCNGVFPNQTVCGNVTGSANLPRATSPSAFLGAAGGTNGQIQYNNGSTLGGFTASGDAQIDTSTGVVTIQPDAITTGKIAPGAVETSDIANNAITNGKLAANAIPVISSRAVAATLDLTAYTAVKTLGYATPGDGGGATFLKVGAVPFKDTYITAGTVVGGSGYGANATYNGVSLGGGSGLGCRGRVTVTGGAVTAVDITGNYCSAYAVGNVLTPNASNMAGTGTGATFTVTTISTQLGSFIDSAANNWQIIADESAFPNVRQYGAKLDWNGVDATATNDILSFRSAIAHAVIPFSTSAAIIFGNTVIIPKGAAYLCAGGTPFTTLLVSAGVILKGAGVYGGTTLKQCTAESSNTHFITLCNPNAGSGEFGCRLEDMVLQMNGASSSTISAIYSASGQQFPLINNVYINPGLRGCIKYEIGTGGASNAIFTNFDCEQSDASTNVAFSGNSSGTQIVIENAVFGCAPSICGAGVYAINALAGNFIVQNVHVENHQSAINVATTGTQMLSKFSNLTLTGGCVNGIRLDVTNPNNTVLVENIESSCSTATILNGHAAGSNVTGHILAQRVFNP